MVRAAQRAGITFFRGAVRITVNRTGYRLIPAVDALASFVCGTFEGLLDWNCAARLDVSTPGNWNDLMMTLTTSHDAGTTIGVLQSAFDTSVPENSRQMRLAIELGVNRVFGVDTCLIEHASRGIAKVALARQVAMYLAHVGCGLTMTAAGSLFGRDRTTVAHACLIIEDRRDDPLFDHAVELLEWAVPAMVLRPGPFFGPFLPAA
jgi:Bacterial dnaA protein helix-turn-helix